MFPFTMVCIAAFYLLTKKDSLRFKQIAWPVYGVIAVTFIIGFLSLKPDTTTYVFWVQLFFLLLLLPVFILVIRKLWQLSKNMPAWVKYSVSIPVSLLFVLTLWICWNMFPIVMYIF
ncbi:hypothetical protein ABE41_015300 [Fictibacillus arsenicus]|uniref:DUF3397 domain-containing protein n=1 Tax=Fictibacillus arsenicus TaxID=255247 RepID=A0A1B1Z7H3_9BACL|nr:hypothetical protein [Fictibacillus arsenicus]ANX13374.1 hypothetical protein ABE41_015300 [Fictibacillus arsenicus]